ncbi:aif1 [Symbiodinium sp. KB8]|nr:aif1 [Symbiodinium sp. KB8]
MEAAAFFIKRTKSRGAAPPAVGSVTVVGMEEEPFERVLGKQVGSIVRQRAEKEGVAFHMRDTVTEFVAAEEDESAVAELELRSGTVLPADIVIIGAGIIPATAWLEGAEGITTAEPRQGGGVICDEFLTAHASGDIYVAGDVAHFPFAHSKGPETASLRIEHYDVAMDHGRIAARNMLGKRVAYDVVPFFWTGLFGMSVRYAGHARRITDTIWHGTPDAQLGGKPVFTAYYVTDDHITGVVTVNDDPKAVACLELFRAGAMPSPEEVRSAASFDPVEALKAISARAGGD